MAVFHVFLLVLVIGIVHHSHGTTNDTQTNYDYFSLVLQWPKSFCNTGRVTCTSSIPNYFIVHGLWPQLYNRPITNCDSDITLAYVELDPTVLDYMNKYWPNLKARPNNISPRDWLWGRWDYEYQKHGSCFQPFQSQTRSLCYAKYTVQMANQIGNVTDMLLHQGRIQPDNQITYPLIAFENAISSYLKFIPRLRCNYARGSGIFQLYEIEFCFNKSLALINCRRDSNCGNLQVQPNPWVMFPPPNSFQASLYYDSQRYKSHHLLYICWLVNAAFCMSF